MMSTSMADASYTTKFGHVVENEEYNLLQPRYDILIFRWLVDSTQSAILDTELACN